MADRDAAYLAESNAWKLLSTMTIFIGLSWLSVALRIYTRAFLMKGLHLDDWLMLLSQAIFSVYAGFQYLGIHEGVGRHNDAFTDEDTKVLALKWQALSVAAYIILMMFIKLSIGILLLRLAAQKVYIWILRVSLIMITVWTTALFFWNIFQCDPVAKQWDYRIPRGHCVGPEEVVAAAYALSAMTVLSDWLFALLPVPMLWNVKMSKQAKSTVILILSIGVFASVATLVRIRYLPELENSDDILYAGTDSMVWTIVEPGLAIIASSLAAIRPLLRAMRVRGFDYSTNTTGISKGSQHAPRSQNSRAPATSYGIYELALTSTAPILQSDIGVAKTCGMQGPAVQVTTWIRGGSSDDGSVRTQVHDLEPQDQENMPSALVSNSKR